MNNMLLVNLTFCLTLVVSVLGTSGHVQNSDLYSDADLHGRTFTANVKFQSHAKSRVHCAALCSQRGEACRAYTFDGITCRGQGADVTSNSPFLATPGAQTFVKVAPAAPVTNTCADVQGSKVSLVYLEDGTPLQVVCHNGWTVFQRRHLDNLNPLNFDRDWTSYQKGFGDLNGEFWLGLETLHRLTSGRQQYSLRVLVTIRKEGYFRHSDFSNFRLANSSTLYRLSSGAFLGGDKAENLPNEPFSTHDHGSRQTCANSTKGGWWFGNCQTPSLNSAYPRWGLNEAFSGTEMKLYPTPSSPGAL